MRKQNCLGNGVGQNRMRHRQNGRFQTQKRCKRGLGLGLCGNFEQAGVKQSITEETEDNLSALKLQAEFLENRLTKIKGRISELEQVNEN